MEEARNRIVSRRRSLAALAAMPFIALGMPSTAIAAGKKRLAVLRYDKRDKFFAGKAENHVKVFAEFGWREGRNLEILWRFTEGESARVPALVTEIVAAKPDVILVVGIDNTRALQQATRTIPILALVPDPVRNGFAQSLAGPGGNITGLAYGGEEEREKMLELLRLLLPRLQALALVGKAGIVADVAELRSKSHLAPLLRKAGIEFKVHGVASIEELRSVLRTLPKDGRGAAILWPLGFADPRAVAQAAIDLRVPAVAENDNWVERGLLMSYQLYYDDELRRVGAILDKLLRGADPAAIPFEFPNRSHLVINRGTARALKLVVPPDLLLRADRVID